MAILWCGGEDIDFPTSVGLVANAGTYHRSDYARCSIRTRLNYAKGVTFSGGAITSGWLSFRGRFDTTVGGNTKVLGLCDSATTSSGIYVGQSSTTSQVIIYTWDSSTKTVLATSTNGLISTGVQKVDMQISSYGATGTVNIYVNGTLAVTYTGDIRITGTAGLDCVCMGESDTYISEIIVSDIDTRNVTALKTFIPTSDGTTTDWTGAYTDVDEATISDADVNYTDTTDKDQQFNVTDLPAGTFYISAVKIAARATKSEDAAIGKIELGWKNGSTTTVGTAQSLTTAWVTYEELDVLDPTTSSAWLQADMNALELTVRSET